MNDADCPFDDLLCQSLSLFHQFRLYDDRMEEDNAFKFLEKRKKWSLIIRWSLCG